MIYLSLQAAPCGCSSWRGNSAGAAASSLVAMCGIARYGKLPASTQRTMSTGPKASRRTSAVSSRTASTASGAISCATALNIVGASMRVCVKGCNAQPREARFFSTSAAQAGPASSRQAQAAVESCTRNDGSHSRWHHEAGATAGRVRSQAPHPQRHYWLQLQPSVRRPRPPSCSVICADTLFAGCPLDVQTLHSGTLCLTCMCDMTDSCLAKNRW